jgi:flagellar basal-body rod modification protein FlgD
MEDKEFISQMAQFTSLEQMKNMNNSVQITQATSFIGKQVTWADSQGNEVKGVVKSVKIVNGEARVIVGNETLELKQILSVSEVATNPVA